MGGRIRINGAVLGHKVIRISPVLEDAALYSLAIMPPSSESAMRRVAAAGPNRQAFSRGVSAVFFSEFLETGRCQIFGLHAGTNLDGRVE
jgi:hypothetical protein